MIEKYSRAICSICHVVVSIMNHVVGRCFISSSQQNSYLGIFVNRNAEYAMGQALCQVVWLVRETAIFVTSFAMPSGPDGHTGLVVQMDILA